MAAVAAPAGPFPDEARKEVATVLGGPFIVFRDKVQQELKLSKLQRQKVLDTFPEYVQETMKTFERIGDLKPQEREKELQAHRRKSDGKLTHFLTDVLQAEQRQRLMQLQLQQAGVFALLGEHKAFADLKITDEQRTQFMAEVQAMHKKIEPLVKEAEASGNSATIMHRVMKIRAEHESRIESILSEAQRKQWQRLLGKPVDLGN